MKDLDEAFWNFDGAAEQGWHFAEGAEEANPEEPCASKSMRINGLGTRDMRDPTVFQTKDDIVSLNDIRVPENKTVYLQVASTDVIHGFALPHFRSKIDAMPGMINHTLVYTAEESEGE